MPRYEFSEGSSNKFWEIALEGKAFTTTWGRIGTAGQSATKKFGSEAQAKKEYEKLIAEKTAKGYRPPGKGGRAGGPEKGGDDEDESGAGAGRYFEFSEGSSNKFWEITVDGKTFVTRYGRIGTDGQKTSKKFNTPNMALEKAEELIAEKVGKGYVQKGGEPYAGGGEEGARAGGARNAELEKAILADPDDEAAYQVYADWLQGEGDPRGELAAVQVALARRKDAKLRARERALIKDNRQQLLGDLPDSSDEEGAPVKLTWQAGWLRTARLSATQEHELPNLCRSLLTCGSARFLRELTIGLGTFDGENDYYDTNEVVEELGLPPSLRMLNIGDYHSEEAMMSSTNLGDVGVWLRGASRLVELTLEGGSMDLGRLDLPELRTFSVRTGGFTAKNIRDVAKARWPKLESLSLYFGDKNYGASGSVKDVRPILEGRGLPALRELGLCNCEFADALAVALAKSPVLRQLRVLDLSQGTLTDKGARALLASAPAFKHLEHLDLTDNYLSDAMVEEVDELCREVEAYGQREGAEEDRYASVGE